MTGPGEPDLFSAIAAIWAEALQVDGLDASSDFLSMGGHSLAAIRVTAQVREIVGNHVPLELIFAEQTLGDYVAAVDALIPT